MKKLLVPLAAILLYSPSLHSQEDEIRSSEIGISYSLYDFPTAQLIRSHSLSYVMANDKWSSINDMVPGVTLHYFKGLKKHIDFAGTLSGAFLNYPMTDKPNNASEKYLFEVNAAAQFKMTSEAYWLQPFLSAGIGAHKYGSYYGATIPLGVGLNIDLFNEAKIFINSQYRVPVTTTSANYHFFHAFGISGRIGKKKEPKVIPPPPPPLPPPPKDTDGDGIIDENDKCPTVPGVVKYQGCPVPDTDGDGINDDDDKCPTVAGVARYQGCPVPDTDKDGINDEEDKCPTVFGLARYQGCPIPDTDGDGLNDEVDKCPNVAGPSDNYGCPVIGIKFYEIVFKTNSAELLTAGKNILDTVAIYLTRNAGVSVTVDGHTDNTGNDKINEPLSLRRAESTKAYLVSKGIDEARMTTAGYGSTRPTADNKTAEGRQKNRRIEIKIKD
jgi:outer membrane protein OmpA-like peptidoglycan-associated protein